jgi:hypothetical protein
VGKHRTTAPIIDTSVKGYVVQEQAPSGLFPPFVDFQTLNTQISGGYLLQANR